MAAKRKHLSAGRPKGSRRSRKRRYLVVTNGEVTEPQYFKGIEKELEDVVIEVRHFRKDPSALAAVAKELKDKESDAGMLSNGYGVDDFQRVYVVTDVDEFTPKQFQEARRTCKEAGMELVLSNPCFEVWLIDHLTCCPDTYSRAKDVERKAVELGIVGGSRDKHIDYSSLEGKRNDACANAGKHNTPERKTARLSLNNMRFGPWTDMPSVIERIDRKKGRKSLRQSLRP